MAQSIIRILNYFLKCANSENTVNHIYSLYCTWCYENEMHDIEETVFNTFVLPWFVYCAATV